MKKPTTVLLLVLVLLGLRAAPARAQRVLLRADVAEDTLYSGYGPNRAFYNHLYVGYLPVVGRDAPGAALRFGHSAEFMLGMRNKVRLSETFSTGLDLRFVRLVYALAQTADKRLPTPALHHRESLSLSQAQLEGFVRLNVGARGNVIGRYLDLTGWGGWVLATAHHTEDRPPTGPRRVQRVERGLPYLQRWPYGAGVRLGTSRYALVARRRFSRTFTAGSPYPELPRWTVGVELGWL